ncbi:hypothetical protein WJX81_000146 [Elliptochloris bilobata]|uniref:c-Myc-binding protein n=1 Tax=Elliptochloris bilobata TaxID=381761 RepID=A0AAW1SK47_9CHLO
MTELTAEEAEQQISFRKYLADSGVLDFTTQFLVALYEEDTRPSNALEFVKSRLGAPTAAETLAREEEARRVQGELAAARAELESLRAQLEALGAEAAPPEA